MSAEWKRKNNKRNQSTATSTRRQNNLKNSDTNTVHRRHFNLLVKPPGILSGFITKVITCKFKSSGKKTKLMFGQQRVDVKRMYLH